MAECGGAAHQGATFPAKAKHGGRSVLNERVNVQTKQHAFIPSASFSSIYKSISIMFSPIVLATIQATAIAAVSNVVAQTLEKRSEQVRAGSPQLLIETTITDISTWKRHLRISQLQTFCALSSSHCSQHHPTISGNMLSSASSPPANHRTPPNQHCLVTKTVSMMD